MGSPARILVVDDSPTILKVVSSILTRHGYDPVPARDGLAGIELIKKGGHYDLVLLDFVMPRMNGYQFCRELRSIAAYRALPVVLMSAKGDKIRGQFVQQTGAVDAITKPFDARALVAVIDGALAKTAEGRARPIPEKMVDEESIADSIRPSAFPRQHRLKSSVEVAQHVALAVAPVIAKLPPAERENEASLMTAIAAALTNEVVDAIGRVLKDVESEGHAKELMGGDISAIPLSEVMQVLQMQRQTGVMRITNPRSSVVVTISMRQGLIDLVQSRGSSDEFRLGRYFVEKGLVSRDELEQVLSEKGEKLIGEALLVSNKITKDDLEAALGRQSSELIYDVLRWPYGRFSFSREPARPEAEAAKLGLAVAGLVLEGFRRVDEWRLMEGVINFDQIVFVDDAAREAVGDAKLTRNDKRVLGAINGSRTVNEVIKESALGSFDAIKAIYQLLQSRAIRPRAA